MAEDDIDLSRLFSGNTPDVSAQRVFANREPEREAFDLTVESYARELEELAAGGWDAQDLDRPRSNVLTFYGMGGIGKTTLLGALRRRIASDAPVRTGWPPRPTASHHLVAAAMDLQGAAMPTIEELLIEIRAALVPTGESFAAFDLLFGTYWARAHPNESLDDFLRSRTRTSRIGEMMGLPEQIETAVGDVAAELSGVSAIGSSLARSVRTVLAMARQRRLTSHVLGECNLLSQLLHSSPREALSYATYPLAWDLARIQQRRRLGLVIFVDTFEDVAHPLELQIQRLTWLLPNALFVIAGRNRLVWGDDASTGPGFRSGPRHWPGLAQTTSDEPRQHLVGYLTESDAADYLRRSLRGPVKDGLLLAVVDVAAGLPLHLDLVVQRWAQVSARRPPILQDVDVPFPDLARSVLRDLSSDERRALLASCLYDTFDVALVQATAGLPVSGPVRRLVDRPLVDERADLPLPYVVHDAFRRTLLRVPAVGDDDWSYADWREAAVRGLDELYRRSHDARDLGFLTTQVFSLARTFDLRDPRLVELAERLTATASWDSAWQADRVPFPQTGATGSQASWVGRLADGLGVVMGRQARPRQAVADDLATLLDDADDSNGELDVLRYFYAEAARDAGAIEESRAALDVLRDRGGRMAGRAIHGRLHLLRREGRFREYDEGLRRYASVLPALHRLQGDLSWTQARFDDAVAYYQAAYADGQVRTDPGEAALCAAFEAFVLGLVRPSDVAAASNRARESLDGRFHSFTESLLHIADGLVQAGSPWATQTCADAREAAKGSGHSSLVVYADFATAFDAAVRDDQNEVLRRVHDLRRHVYGRVFGYVVEIAATWSGTPPGVHLSDWMDDDVLSRWKAIVRHRRGYIG